MTRTTLAVAADYADALLVARRSKNCLFLLLLLVLLLQIAVFCLYHFDVFHAVSKVNITTTPAAAVSVTPEGQPAQAHGVEITLGLYRWVLNFTTFLGMTLVIVLAVVLLLTSVIMLVGRLIGVSHLTSAFVWCVFLAVILFPWQALLNSGSGTYEGVPSAGEAYTSPAKPDQRLPGILTTWTEVERSGQFESKPVTPEVVLHWMRFVGWPVVAIALLMIVQGKGSRGLRFALGESDIPVEVNLGRTNETGI
jgi:hypothetical protein